MNLHMDSAIWKHCWNTCPVMLTWFSGKKYWQWPH